MSEKINFKKIKRVVKKKTERTQFYDAILNLSRYKFHMYLLIDPVQLFSCYLLVLMRFDMYL